MACSQFSIKTVGVHFCNSAYDDRNWDQIYDNSTYSYLEQNTALFEKKKVVNQILWSKLWYVDQIYTIPKSNWKKIEKNNEQFLLEQKKKDLSGT